MTVVQFPRRSFEQTFNNLVDDFLFPTPSLLRNGANGQVTSFNTPVNVRKTEQGYELQVIAPGFEKEAFKIDLENDLLTISAQYKAEEDNQNEKHIRREFKVQSFKRSFSLDESIDAEGIQARYNNGILLLSLPKKSEVKAPVKQIAIQ